MNCHGLRDYFVSGSESGMTHTVAVSPHILPRRQCGTVGMVTKLAATQTPGKGGVPPHPVITGTPTRRCQSRRRHDLKSSINS